MSKPAKIRRIPTAQAVSQPPDPNRRSQIMATRVSPLEQQRIMTAAIAAQLSPSEFMRRAALGVAAVAHGSVAATPSTVPQFPKTFVPLVRELNALGVNLNQLARVANMTGHIPPDLDDLLDVINDALDRMIALERRG